MHLQMRKLNADARSMVYLFMLEVGQFVIDVVTVGKMELYKACGYLGILVCCTRSYVCELQAGTARVSDEVSLWLALWLRPLLGI